MYPGASARRCFAKKIFLKIFQNSLENNFVGVSVLIKLQAVGLQLCKKDYSAGVFSCVFYKVFQNTFFIEWVRVLLYTGQITFWFLMYFLPWKLWKLCRSIEFAIFKKRHSHAEIGNSSWENFLTWSFFHKIYKSFYM